MGLSLKQRSRLYTELHQLLHGGIPLAGAVRALLAQTQSGGEGKFLRRLDKALASGSGAGDALRVAGVSPLESSLVSATARSGHLAEGCRHLADYFRTLAAMRAAILQRLTYPAFLLHFGVFILALPALVVGGGVKSYFLQTLGFLAALYGVAAVLVVGGCLLVAAAARSRPVDSLLRAIPVAGAVRRNAALHRFCMVYEMQLAAGVNVIDGLASAAEASESATLTSAVRRVTPGLREGNQPAALLAQTSAFPQKFLRALAVGEQTGKTDETLVDWTNQFQTQSLAAIESVTEWLPRAIYVLILAYLGWQVVSLYQGIVAGYQKILDF